MWPASPQLITRCAMLMPAPATLVRSLTSLFDRQVRCGLPCAAEFGDDFLIHALFPSRIALVLPASEKRPAPSRHRPEYGSVYLRRRFFEPAEFCGRSGSVVRSTRAVR